MNEIRKQQAGAYAESNRAAVEKMKPSSVSFTNFANGSGGAIFYTMEVHTDSRYMWQVEKRYSQFSDLRKILQKEWTWADDGTGNSGREKLSSFAFPPKTLLAGGIESLQTRMTVRSTREQPPNAP